MAGLHDTAHQLGLLDGWSGPVSVALLPQLPVVLVGNALVVAGDIHRYVHDGPFRWRTRNELLKHDQ